MRVRQRARQRIQEPSLFRILWARLPRPHPPHPAARVTQASHHHLFFVTMLTHRVGAIAGGVVGGVLGLAVLALIAWLLARKKSQQTQVAPSEKFGAQDNGYPVQQPYNAGQYAPVPPNQGGYNNQGHPGFAQPYAAPETPGTGYKPYDPSDPSTFPATPANGGPPTIYSQGPTEYSHPRPGQYNYAAEL
ncbi:hypothetical protein FRC08_003610 [Ceratobasidium sp. 394]|nr:hypothetical protein FRC08_003610 [Ceratobasidium sp. 394]